MNSLARRARAALAVSALAIGVLSLSPLATAWGYTLPFTDTNIDGKLTFCNQHNQPVTSGSIETLPFVWKTISSAAPPKGYGGKTGQATLDAYQPIQYVDPGDWSGMQLNGSSWFSNPDHPVAQSTDADLPLVSMVQAYPPHWDGLLEIRMLFSATNEEQIQSPYPAAVVKITGKTWTLVWGGGGNCSQGTGLSDETVYLSKPKLAAIRKQVEKAVSGHGGSSGNGSSSGPASSSAHPGNGSSTGAGQSPGASGTGTANSNGGSGGRLAASTSSTGISTGAAAGIGIGVIALIAVVLGTVLWWRRRTA
jgi:hypothetical protein